MTFRETLARIMSKYWSSALFLGGFWTLGMILWTYVTPPAGGPKLIDLVILSIGGVGFGLSMAFWFRRRREKLAKQEATRQDQA